MTPDPFIRDAAFRGSPILSYGTASRGSAWPKILAIAAGIFVVLFVAFVSIFWFLTNVPVPKGNVMTMVLPSDTELNVNAPLSWKQNLELNKPMPTIVGLVKDGAESRDYAIRLSPATAIIGRTSLWHISSEEDLEIVDYRTPYEVFGWPWEVFKGEMKLEARLRDMFSDGVLDWEDLPDRVEGVVNGNKWETNLPIVGIRSGATPANGAGFVTLDDGALDVLQNFLNYYGAWISQNDAGQLIWKFDPDMVTLNYEGSLGEVSDESGLVRRDFILDDGDVVQRLYWSPAQSTATGYMASNTRLSINVEQSGVGIHAKNVSGLTCDGERLAAFDRQSLQNFCSWIDICYFEFENIVFLNEDGYLTVCGY